MRLIAHHEELWLRGTCSKRRDCNFYLDEGCRNPTSYDCYEPERKFGRERAQQRKISHLSVMHKAR